MKLGDFSRVKLANLPTPLDEAPVLAREIGVERLFVKRDDLTGLALGGNKARKLEFLIGDALSQGANVVITCGGRQSNHARMTAGAACRFGMRCVLFLSDPTPETFEGNLLLDTIYGAEMRFLGTVGYSEVEQAMEAEAEKQISNGMTPYVIPVGGSNRIGALGYVMGVEETAEQLRAVGVDEADMVVAVGSGGTLAGMTVGCSLHFGRARLVGISVGRPAGPGRERVIRIAEQSAESLGLDSRLESVQVEVYDQYVGQAYGIPTDACKEAILLAARAEGLILDPVYTGKAMAGLIDLVKKGVIGKERPVVFWHTGGAGGLFAHSPLFHDEARRLAKYMK